MRGEEDAAEERHQLVLYGAWRAEAFAREDRLRPLKHYLKKPPRAAKASPRQTAAERAAALAGMPGATTTIVDRPRPKASQKER